MRSALVPSVLAAVALFATEAAWAGATLSTTTPIVGDGKTAAILQVLVDDPTAKVKVKADRGRVGTITPVAGGALIEFIPPTVGETTEMALQVQVRGSAVSEDIVGKVTVVPPFAGGFRFTFDPAIGTAKDATTIKVAPATRSAQPDAQRRLRIAVSAGTVTELVPSGDGAFVARYTPPANLAEPLSVMVGVADLAAPWDTLGSSLLPITVERDVTLDVAPDSNNVLKVGAREFGPVKASPAGKATFRMPLHPTLVTGVLTTVKIDGAREVRNVDLPVKVGPSVLIAPLPANVPAGQALPVTIFCAAKDATPCAPETVTLAASIGTVSSATALQPGVLRATWTLPATGTGTVTATVGDGKATANVTVIGAPVAMTLSANPPELAAGKKDFTVTAHVKDTNGTGVVGRPPMFTAEGATPSGKPKDNGDGSYTLAFKATADRAAVRASPPLQASGLPARRLVAWPDRAAVWADGRQTVMVTVVAEDALGLPVPNVDLTLSVPQGDGSVPPSVKTGADGAARVAYRVGNAAGPVSIVAKGAGLEAAATLWQAAPGGAAPEVRPTGSQPHLDALARWQAAMPVTHLEPQAVAVVAAPAPTPVAAPPPVAPTAAPPTMAAPPPMAATPTTMTPSGPSASPTTAKAPRAPSEGHPLRVRGRLVDAPFRYESELDGEAAEFAPAASFKTSPYFGAVGGDASAEAWFGPNGGVIGAEARVLAVGYALRMGEEDFRHIGTDISVGGRYRKQLTDGVWAWGGLGFQRTGAILFGYADSARTTAKLVDFPLNGGRLSGGARFERDLLLIEAQVSETFAPFPVLTRGDLLVDIPTGSELLALHVGLGLSARHMTFGIDDGKMKVRQAGWDVGAGVTLVPF